MVLISSSCTQDDEEPYKQVLDKPQRVNPVEHLWEKLREKYLHNHVFASLDLLVDELCHGLNALTENTARLISMMSFPHLKLSH